MAPVGPLPAGTVTFLFTDIEGSTRLWEQHSEAMRRALARHDALLRHAIESHSGHVFKTMGDQFCAAFAAAPAAVAAALTAQRALQAEAWGEVGVLRARTALHTGAAEAREGDYFGSPLNRVARLLEAGHGGQILLSQATYDLTRDHLPEGVSLRDLDEHRLKDLHRPEHVFQLLHPDLPADFAPLRSLNAFTHNLPAQLTRFIGREREMANVKRLLDSTRLLTLTGSGGCGKTRLALQIAADLVDGYADGVWLVELAALADPALVPQTVAAALVVREQPGRPLTQTLVDYLRSKRLLLLLDNCEHLLAACAQLADCLLRACPNLRILASSREGLGIPGEQTYPVPSLSLPDPNHLPPPESLRAFEAVHLFVDRAVLSQPGFTLTEANAAAVAQVCQRLDGIPLAIELAAARVKALPVEQIGARLHDMFRLLTGGSRTALPRQQTLRALIDWSYELLSEGERVLLRRLSVFAGGFTLEAAEAVCAGEEVIAYEVLDLLSHLVGKSLVTLEETSGEGRYRLLETVRQYSRDRLLETGEMELVRLRHRDWFLALAERAERKLREAEPHVWLERLEREHDNLRAALGWSLECGAGDATDEGARSGGPDPGETALRLASVLSPFWVTRGYLNEGRGWLDEALAHTAALGPSKTRARALNGRGSLARRQGDWGAARSRHEEALAIWQELGDNSGIAHSIRSLGALAMDQADYAAAQVQLEEALAVWRELGDRWGIGWALHGLGAVARLQGQQGVARPLFEEGLAIARELRSKVGMAHHLHSLGLVTFHQGDYRGARSQIEESVVLARQVGDRTLVAHTLSSLGRVTHGQGDYGAAGALFRESLALMQHMGDRQWMPECMEGLASVTGALGEPVGAARLFGAAEALRETMGSPLPPADRADYERHVAAVRAALKEEVFTAAWAEGQTMPLEQTLQNALREVADG